MVSVLNEPPGLAATEAQLRWTSDPYLSHVFSPQLAFEIRKMLSGAISAPRGPRISRLPRDNGCEGLQSVSQGFICEIINKRANTCDPTIEEYVYSCSLLD